MTSRLAKLTVTGDTWASDKETDSPESYSDDSEDSSFVSPPDSPSTAATEVTEEPESDLEPNEIIELIVDEFGALTKDGEFESLVLELDAGLFNDILIAVRLNHIIRIIVSEYHTVGCTTSHYPSSYLSCIRSGCPSRSFTSSTNFEERSGCHT